MARNVEIKARVESFDLLIDKVSAIADKGPMEIRQHDAFFNCAEGRLKLRILSEHSGELIFYQRTNNKGPKESYYLISPTDSPETLMKLLSAAYGCLGQVRKKRGLYHAGRSRIHLDQVVGLGNFLEIERILDDEETAAAGMGEVWELLDAFGIQTADLVEGAYLDLIAQGGTSDA
jgi:predicted adenylyl cyclase CyaB